MMRELQQKFEKARIIRDWKLKDMVFDVHIENKRIKGIVLTDWKE